MTQAQARQLLELVAAERARVQGLDPSLGDGLLGLVLDARRRFLDKLQEQADEVIAQGPGVGG